MNREMFGKLREYVGSDQLISIYPDSDDPESFTVAFLTELNQNHILINMINKAGEENGFYLFPTKDIFMFSTDEEYYKKIKKLFAIKKQKKQKILASQANLMVSLLDYATQIHCLVEINNNTIGYVQNITEQVLQLELVDNCGNFIGSTSLDTDYINSIRCSSKYLKDIELLMESKE